MMETINVDSAVCPLCRHKFHPEKYKYSEWGRSYTIACPHCGVDLEMFESIEYQVSVLEDEK